MTLDEFQTAARATAVYETPVVYPALGLAGEAGELLAAYHSGLGAARVGRVLAEAFDLCWYCAALAGDLGLTLSRCVALATEAPTRLTVSRGYETAYGLSLDVVIVALGAVEQVKKSLRDDGGTPSPARVETVGRALGHLWFIVADLSSRLGSPLDDVLTGGLEKLRSRKERGKIRGEGDDR